MTVRAAELLEQAETLSEKATSNPTLDRYNHGGGRIYVIDETQRRLIADLYQEADREFYFAARSLVPALAARLRGALTVIEAARVALNEMYGSYESLAFAVDVGRRDLTVAQAMQWDGPICARNVLGRIAAFDAGPAATEEAKT